MPLIYSTKELEEMYNKLLPKRAEDVIILKNSVMAYSFRASARAIFRAWRPKDRPRDMITIAATSIPSVTEALNGKGLSVYVCDLDEAPPNEYLGRSLYAG